MLFSVVATRPRISVRIGKSSGLVNFVRNFPFPPSFRIQVEARKHCAYWKRINDTLILLIIYI